MMYALSTPRIYSYQAPLKSIRLGEASPLNTGLTSPSFVPLPAVASTPMPTTPSVVSASSTLGATLPSANKQAVPAQQVLLPPAQVARNLVVNQLTIQSPSSGKKLFTMGENPDTHAAQLIMYGEDGKPVAFLNSNVNGKSGSSLVLSSKKLVTMLTASEGTNSEQSRTELNAGIRTYWQPQQDQWQLVTYQGPTLSDKRNVIGVNGVFSVPQAPENPNEPIRSKGRLDTPSGPRREVRAIVVN
ncbi:MAG: hypothetical protein ACKO37_07720 [Vampirovibrionales bacterium]